MEAVGFQSIFPMNELSIMGFVEIIPKIPHILKRIRYTIQQVLSFAPDIVITIDSPDFCFRVAKKLKALKLKCKLIHYVAPSVWAYRPKRAKAIAKIYDHLLCLLPFEPVYFTEVGLGASFIGHPIIEEVKTGDRQAFRHYHQLTEDDPLLCVMPGSRKGEIQRLLPIFMEATELLRLKIPHLKIVIPTISEEFATYIKLVTDRFTTKPIIITNCNKEDVFAAADFALAKSGTNILELSLARLPMIVAYKVNYITGWLLKKMLKIPYVSIANLCAGREIIPEFLQEDCCPETLADALYQIYNVEEIKAAQIEGCKYAHSLLGLGNPSLPSEQAAKIVMKLLKH
jgi:lipid-A-disaccharide synthase